MMSIHDRSVLANSLRALNELIRQGVEYPDAEARVMIAFSLTDAQCDALRDAYDAYDDQEA